MVPTYLTTVVNYGTEYNGKVFPVHIASMLHGAQVGADSIWPETHCEASLKMHVRAYVD
jgi:hypothetical protein